ncbi:MAG: pirin family protein [Acidimicrobiales bacterium]
MSGPVNPADASPDQADAGHLATAPLVELSDSRTEQVGHVTVRRALPRRGRRTVGAWCFADHMGPATVTEDRGLDIGPHPHIGLQTVTWLTDGEVLHRDSLGSEQVIKPGQLNLMTAGRGVAHAEERTGRYRGPLAGIQLWVALPEATRHGPAAFEHHAELPRVDLDGGVATVLVGQLGDLASPVRHDTPLVGADLDLRRAATVPLRADFEHALVVLDGTAVVDGATVSPGKLAYLGSGRDELGLQVHGQTRAILIGGEPFGEQILMWWNFVARTRREIDEARTAWADPDGRFGSVRSTLPLIPAPVPFWQEPG